MEQWDLLLTQLQDSKHLNRQSSLKKIHLELCKSDNQSKNIISYLCNQDKILMESNSWETLQSSFLLAVELIKYSNDIDFFNILISNCHKHLTNKEIRVRLATSECLKELAKKKGICIYECFKEQLLKMIIDNFERTKNESEDCSTEIRKHGTNLMHDTEGWKFLETSLISLRLIIEGTGSDFVPHMTHDLLKIIFGCLHHTNRFVREGGFFTVTALCSLCSNSNIFEGISLEIAKQLSIGLADNWSQVRYAASVATREFMKQVKDKQTFYPLLLPRMCLNRYYVAEGVKLYSINTWKEIIGTSGKEAVASCMKEVVEFYGDQAKANNHAVREASCHCIAELGLRMNKDTVRPFVDDLLKALMLCFRDASWPVRDAACTACGNFIMSFPEESKNSIDELFSLWSAHLIDNIASVRDNTAIALGNYMRAYGDIAVNKVKKLISDNIPKAKLQPIDSHLNQNIENTTIFGVAAKKLRDNDPSLHSQKQQYSCGSLGPKLKRGSNTEDFGFENGTEPWEASDGALYLLREYSELYPNDPFIISFFPILVEIADIRSFAHYHFLNECLWNQLVKIAKNIGDKFTIDIMKSFIPPLFNSLQCENRIAMNASGYAISELSKQIGIEKFYKLITEEQKIIMNNSSFVKI